MLYSGRTSLGMEEVRWENLGVSGKLFKSRENVEAWGDEHALAKRLVVSIPQISLYFIAVIVFKRHL